MRDLVLTLWSSQAISHERPVFASDSRALLRVHHHRWDVGKNETRGIIQAIIGCAERRGFIRLEYPTGPANPVVFLTSAGIAAARAFASIDDEQVISAAPTPTSDAPSSDPEVYHEAAPFTTTGEPKPSPVDPRVATEPVKRRELSEMALICKQGGWGPFSSVRLEMYTAMGRLAGTFAAGGWSGARLSRVS